MCVAHFQSKKLTKNIIYVKIYLRVSQITNNLKFDEIKLKYNNKSIYNNLQVNFRLNANQYY